MKINSGTILIAFFAILAGMVGAYVYRQLNQPVPVVQAPAPPKPQPPRTMVVPMVSRNLTPGQEITMDDVALVRLNKTQLDELGLKKAFMTKPEQIIGKTVKAPLRRGSTFDTRDFYPPGQRPGIAHRLKPGLRAVTVSMPATNALLGFAGAGQKVDVLFHYGESEAANGTSQPNRAAAKSLRSATSTLVQSAEILALNQVATPTPEANTVSAEQRTLVTLAVYPREAELLRVARGHGELSLALRNPTDEKAVPLVDPRTVDEIINVRSSVRVMEIYRGKQISRLQFASSGGINRRLIDGSRDNKVAAVIEEAKQKQAAAAESDQSATPAVNANHAPAINRNPGLAPVLGGDSIEPTLDAPVDRSFEPGVELHAPNEQGWQP